MIFRLAAIGDTLVALPAFRYLRQRHPEAEIHLLTGQPAQGEPPAQALMGPLGLIDKLWTYQTGERRFGPLKALAATLRAQGFDRLYYVTEPRGLASVWRDAVFFALACGITRIEGLPWHPGLMNAKAGEREAERLLRCLGVQLAPDRLKAQAGLDLTSEERVRAAELLAPLGTHDFWVIAPTAKFRSKAWPEAAWRSALTALGARHGGRGLVALGGPQEDAALAAHLEPWPGPKLALAGAPLRASAAILAKAKLFLGTDSGLMHLAAAVDTPLVALFAGVHPAGLWAPISDQVIVLRRPTPCAPCRQATCGVTDHPCMSGIAPSEVVAACVRVLDAAP